MRTTTREVCEYKPSCSLSASKELPSGMTMDNGTESRLVQANNGRLAGGVIDGHNVEAQRAL